MENYVLTGGSPGEVAPVTIKADVEDGDGFGPPSVASVRLNRYADRLLTLASRQELTSDNQQMLLV